MNDYHIDDVDLHAYVVVQDGRTYTAISRMPPAIGFSMQVLYPLGSPLGWLFALPKVAMAKNGFMITGGTMNRTAEIRFQSGEYVSVKQQLVGQDAQGYMRMNTQVNGRIPSIPVGSKVEVDDYHVDFRRISAGRTTITHLKVGHH